MTKTIDDLEKVEITNVLHGFPYKGMYIREKDLRNLIIGNIMDCHEPLIARGEGVMCGFVFMKTTFLCKGCKRLMRLGNIKEEELE